MIRPNSEKMLHDLLEGNRRFQNGQSVHPHQDPLQRLKLLKNHQQPQTAIIGCADPQVAPEILFDQGLGDLFVIRIAGNIIDDAVIGSLEYAIEQSGLHLIMVLGHSGCRVVQAALQEETSSGKLLHIVQAIRPAIEDARASNGNLRANAEISNIRHAAQQLKRRSQLLRDRSEKNCLTIVGAIYQQDTGVVHILP
jgi:carbonic anhydrase